ncbi:MAG: SMI1/KNR4 family protein [Hormoscilla sp. GM102CHS1]|nr:SMI1/KNR4 family protein [Hormoscilla sp. GM102CHS1]
METVEARLGTALPPSYREFLKVTNGIRSLDGYGIRFYSTEEIDWFCVKNQDWIDIWTEGIKETPSVPDEKYFIYGEEYAGCYFRNEYMQTALEISSECDGYIYQLSNDRGEWRMGRLGLREQNSRSK